MSTDNFQAQMPDPLGNPVEFGFHHEAEEASPPPTLVAPHVRHRWLLVGLFALFLGSACLFLLR